MKTFIVMSALLALTACTPVYHVLVKENGLGAYKLDQIGEEILRKEVRSENGDTAGSYKYTSPDGQVYVVDYVSGANQGFVATGKHLPVAVTNPEVLKATKEHLAAWEHEARTNGIFEEKQTLNLRPLKKTVLVPVIDYVEA